MAKHVYMLKIAYQKGPLPILGINICPIALLREHAASLHMSLQAIFKVKCPSFTPTQMAWRCHRRLPLYMLSTLFLVRFDISFICQMTLDRWRPHHHHTYVLIFFIHSLLISWLSTRTLYDPTQNKTKQNGCLQSGTWQIVQQYTAHHLPCFLPFFVKCCKRCYYYCMGLTLISPSRPRSLRYRGMKPMEPIHWWTPEMELKGLFFVEVSTYKSQFTRNEVGALWL